MRFNLVGVLRTLASISLLLGLAVASWLGLMAVDSFLDIETAASPLESGLTSMVGNALLGQSLIVGFTSLVIWALLLAVSEGLRMLYAIAENTGAALDQLPGQGDPEPREEPGR